MYLIQNFQIFDLLYHVCGCYESVSCHAVHLQPIPSALMPPLLWTRGPGVTLRACEGREVPQQKHLAKDELQQIK